MRLLRVPDGFVTDMLAQGPRVLMTLRWHVRPPDPDDLIETTSFGTWQVEELLSGPNEHRGPVVAVRTLTPDPATIRSHSAPGNTGP
ncbi:hypothetical protein [Deinococcus depolymerans]|uniref:hypothetical protein n=1 Tax=Deinococcus depolymerans TaxID=392408 RepID=UPI0031F084FA